MIRVVTDGVMARGQSRNIIVTHEHRYREFARARLSLEDGQGDVFELELDDAGNLELRQLPRYNEGGEPQTRYRSTTDERKAT